MPRLKFRLPIPPQFALALPVDTNPIDSWTELAAMVTVVVALVGGIQFLITKLMVMPVVADSIVKWNDNMKEWVEEADRKYVNGSIFAERQRQEDRRQDSIEKRQENIERRIEHVIDLINNNGRRQ